MTSFMSCSTSTTAMPVRGDLAQQRGRAVRVSSASSPAAGSSSSSTPGASASARAISTRRLSTCGSVAGARVERAGDSRRMRAGFRRAPLLRIAVGREQVVAAETAAPQRDQHVVDHRHLREQLRGLVGARDAGARDAVRRAARRSRVAEPDRCRVGAIEAAEQVEHRALAGAVRADEAGDRARARASNDEVAHRAHAAEAHRQAARRERLARAPRAKMSRDVARSPAAVRLAPACRRSGRSSPTKPSGASSSTTSSSGPTNSSRYWASHDSSSGSSTTIDRADQRAQHPLGAADHHHQQEQDRLEEREGLRADEVADRARTRRRRGRPPPPRCANAAVRISDRVEADRLARDLRIAHRAHGLAPGAGARASA